MKLRMMAGGFVLGIAAALTTSSAISQDKAGGGKGAPQQPTPAEMQTMMEEWTKAMTPGEPHKQMARSAGTWDTVTRVWMAGPDQPPTESKGVAEIKSILGGRFIQETLKYDFPMPDPATGAMKMVPVEGTGLFGFDNYQQMYVGCWADNMNTFLLSMRGNLSQDGKTLTMYGQMDEPMLGVKGRYVKYVTEHVDDSHHTFRIFDLHAGDNYKVVEIAYTRRK